MYPEWLASALLVLCLIQVVRILSGVEAGRAGAGDEGAPSGAGVGARSADLLKVAAGLGVVVTYLLLLRPLGYHIATPLLMAALFLLLGIRNVLWLIGLALATSLVTAMFFEKLLNVVLPVGMFALSL